MLENPGWCTQYTPYQPEIAQGRLEALLNFQTLVTDLTGLDIANASLLDEGTAAAEAMGLSYGMCKQKASAFFVSERCHPQTIEVIQTRSLPLGIEVIVGDHRQFDFATPIFGALLQYPATDGAIYDYRDFIAQAHERGDLVTVAADLLALTLQPIVAIAHGPEDTEALPIAVDGIVPAALILVNKTQAVEGLPFSVAIALHALINICRSWVKLFWLG